MRWSGGGGWRADRSGVRRMRMGIDKDFWQASRREPEPGLVVGAGNDRDRNHALLVDAIRLLRERRPARLEIATFLPVVVPADLGRKHVQLTHPELRDLYTRATVVAVATR